jgi:hypothetical protein
MEAFITIRKINNHASVKHIPTSGCSTVSTSYLDRLKDGRRASWVSHSTETIGTTTAGLWAGEHSIGYDFLNDNGNEIPERFLTAEPRCGM